MKKQVFRKYKLHMNSLRIKFSFPFTEQALPNNSSLLAELSKPNACKAEESWYWNNHRRRWPTRQHGSQCQIWGLHHLLLHNTHDYTFFPGPGTKTNISVVVFQFLLCGCMEGHLEVPSHWVGVLQVKFFLWKCEFKLELLQGQGCEKKPQLGVYFLNQHTLPLPGKCYAVNHLVSQ